MTLKDCPIAYDHTDDLDECAVCGWGAPEPPPPRSGQDVEGWIKALNAISCCGQGPVPDAKEDTTP